MENAQKWNKQEVANQNIGASLKNLETQLGQLVNTLSRRPQVTFPSNTEKNPREEINAITLKNGKELEEVEKEQRKKMEKGKKVMEETPEIDESKPSRETLKVKETPKVKKAPKVSAYKAKVPFLARLK